MRRSACSVLVVSLVLGACGGGSDSSQRRKTCAVLARLEDAALAVARADVADPVAFEQVLRNSVDTYVTAARELRPLVPPGVQAAVDRVIADVQQQRFDDAVRDRAPLDAFAAAQRCLGAGGATTTTT